MQFGLKKNCFSLNTNICRLTSTYLYCTGSASLWTRPSKYWQTLPCDCNTAMWVSYWLRASINNYHTCIFDTL